MKSVIWKYTLGAPGVSVVSMPRGARILTCNVQGHDIRIWAAVDPEMPMVGRRFLLVGTGQETEYLEGPYISTVFWGGGLVFHVFDLGETF